MGCRRAVKGGGGRGGGGCWQLFAMFCFMQIHQQGYQVCWFIWGDDDCRRWFVPLELWPVAKLLRFSKCSQCFREVITVLSAWAAAREAGGGRGRLTPSRGSHAPPAASDVSAELTQRPQHGRENTGTTSKQQSHDVHVSPSPVAINYSSSFKPEGSGECEHLSK